MPRRCVVESRSYGQGHRLFWRSPRTRFDHRGIVVTFDRAAKASAARWRTRPIEMVQEEFSVEPDAWQADALTAFADFATQPRAQGMQVSARRPSSPGSSSTSSRPGTPKVIATSITEGNLNTNLWPEPEVDHLLRVLPQRSSGPRRASPTATTLTRSRRPFLAEAGERRAAGDALAGVHADHVMAVADESGGMPQAVMTTLEAVLASCIEGKVVQSGNLTHTTGPALPRLHARPAPWRLITITGDRRSEAVVAHQLEAQQQIASYGRDNPWSWSTAGEFPPSSINAPWAPRRSSAMARHSASTSTTGPRSARGRRGALWATTARRSSRGRLALPARHSARRARPRRRPRPCGLQSMGRRARRSTIPARGRRRHRQPARRARERSG